MSSRSAMTLIEIVAGLVILGTILASVAIARGRFVRQWATAERTLVATKAVDALIAGWMESTPPEVPLNRQGMLAGVQRHVWRTRVVRDAGAAKLLANIVRVEVFDLGLGDRVATPVVSVDLLLHNPPRRATTGPAARGEAR